MASLSRQEQLRSIHTQLEHWRQTLSARVADEAQALDVELDKLHDDEIDDVWQALRTGQEHVLAGCDTVRDLRRRLQDREASSRS